MRVKLATSPPVRQPLTMAVANWTDGIAGGRKAEPPDTDTPTALLFGLVPRLRFPLLRLVISRQRSPKIVVATDRMD
jgi:hypothetical protein